MSELDPSPSKYFPSISRESGTVLGAGDTTGNKKDQVCPHEQRSPVGTHGLFQWLENVRKKQKFASLN